MPKIAKIELASLEFTMGPGRNYGTSRGLNLRRGCSLIKVETDEGIVGVGDASGPLGVVREYLSVVRPYFIGRSLYDFDIVAAKVIGKLYHFGAQSHLTSYLGGLDVAITDAIGKTLKISAHDFLGGRASDRLPCYATTGFFVDDPQNEIERQRESIADVGFAGVKIKIGMSPASDLERVRTARRILGDDILLMVDINANYTVDTALQTLRKIEPYDIHWCEEPLPPADIAGYSELRARSPIPIAAGEAHYASHDFRRLVEARALDILQPSIPTGGGFAEAKAVALLARMHNLRISPPCFGSAVALAASVHFAASLPVWPHNENIPYPMLVEYDVTENPFREKLAVNPITPKDGLLEVPSGDGLGLQIDWDFVEAMRVP
jgi:D-galactarolactone cycloisomerase